MKFLFFGFPVEKLLNSVYFFLVSVYSLSQKLYLSSLFLYFLSRLYDSIFKIFSIFFLEFYKSLLFRHDSLLLRLVFFLRFSFTFSFLPFSSFFPGRLLDSFFLLLLLRRKMMLSISFKLLLFLLSLSSFNILFKFPILVFDNIHVLFDFVQTLKILKLLEFAFQITLNILIHFFQFMRFITSILYPTSISKCIMHSQFLFQISNFFFISFKL